MARKKQQQGEGKAGIIIVLAFFMLVSAVLGYLTYEFYSQIEQANAESKKDKEEAAAVGKLRRVDQDRVALLRSFLGIATQQEQETLKQLSEESSVALRKDHAELMDAINKDIDATITTQTSAAPELKAFTVTKQQRLQWDWPQGGVLPSSPTPKSLPAWTVEALAARELALSRVNQRLGILADLEKKLMDEKAAYEKGKQDLDKVVAEIPVKYTADEAARAKQLDTRLKAYEKHMQDYRLFKGELDDERTKLRNLETEANKLLEHIKDLNLKLAAKEAEKEDVFPYDTPKGSIEVRRKDNLVEINLGYSDNVKAGLTFNVMPLEVKDKGLQSRIRTTRDGNKQSTRIEPKGTIEVLEVIGPHLSTARITSEEQPIREPIMRTDLIFNAAWRKGQPDHIVLVGVFDIDGDGTDDTVQVVRELTRMGIVVDGYYDLIARKWVGGGPTKRTNTCVVGDYPRITAADALQTAKSELSSSIAAARQLAVNEGAKAVPHRDFFPRIGYKVKLDTSDDRINQAAAKFLRTVIEAPPAEAPKQ